MLLLLVFALAFSWFSVLVGVLAKDPEQVQLFGFTVLFPITFVSNVFVPAETMPGWLQTFVEVNPISISPTPAGDSCSPAPKPHPSSNPWYGPGSIAAIFAPLSVWAFKRRV